MRREPVDSSRTNFVRNASRPSSSMSSSTRASTFSSASNAAGRCSAALERVAHLDLALERDRDALLDGQRREEPGVLERAAEPAPGAPSARRSVTSWPPSTIRAAVERREAGDEVEQRRLARAVRADDADDLAACRP